MMRSKKRRGLVGVMGWGIARQRWSVPALTWSPERMRAKITNMSKCCLHHRYFHSNHTGCMSNDSG